MAERTTVVYPNPQILAEAVAARTLLTITRSSVGTESHSR